MSDYKKTIGIEVHCELKTNTKMFSTSTNGYQTIANKNICAIDLSYPGTLPVVNKYAVELALKAAMLLNCKINKTMHFDRKNYFYPDLPKGYQITQARTPIGVDGYVLIEVDGQPKKIGIHDIHIEEDTAKSIHKDDKSYLDFNRAGVPLIEIVTKPDMSSDKEAMAYLEKLKEILFYADISDCKMEEGSMRCDVNVSISKDDTLGVRTETKNIGSISSVGLAINTEAHRQEEVLTSGGTIREETRRYEEKENKTILMRVKETGNDYRYFPEADIPYLVLTDDFIDRCKNSIPIMPDERRKIYKENGICEVNIEKIIQDKKISDYLLNFNDINLKIASNLLLGDIRAYLNKTEKSLEDTHLTTEKFKTVVNKLDSGEIPNKVFKDILVDLLETDKTYEQIISTNKIETISDTSSLEKIVETVLNNNEPSIIEYKNGHDRVLKFLMGQIMKETKGSANPALVNKILLEKIEKR